MAPSLLPIAVVALERDGVRYTVTACPVDEHCRLVLSREGKPDAVPNWRALSTGSDYQGKDWGTPEEAWDSAQTLLKRLVAWGWELRNADNQVINTWGKPQ